MDMCEIINERTLYSFCVIFAFVWMPKYTFWSSSGCINMNEPLGAISRNAWMYLGSDFMYCTATSKVKLRRILLINLINWAFVRCRG